MRDPSDSRGLAITTRALRTLYAMTSKGIPKSRARTAYGLLSEVRALILAEPKRYDQGLYIMRADDDKDSADVRRGYPSCGTVACVAGWVATLAHSEPFHAGETVGIASHILGLSWIQTGELFNGSAVSDHLGPQTKRYAKAGAKHIADFQRKHRAQLKTTRVSK